MSRRQLPTVRLRRLASELRVLRATAGMTRDDVSKATGINAATLYRIETARVHPQRRTLVALLDIYHIESSDRRADLIELSKQTNQLGWLYAYESELPEEYTTYISFEAEARSVRTYESLFVPGLLQIPEYSRAVISGLLPQASAEDVESRVDARQKRQSAMVKDDPLKVWAIVDEAVLRRQVGGQAVMRAQLQYLVEQSNKPHITVQVLPYTIGAHPGMSGAFVMMDFPDRADPDLVYLENAVGAMFLERDTDVYRYAEIFEYLRAVALHPRDSVRMVADMVAIL